jgi:signal transduction histidine kinase/CHASE3 domain sensor protein
VPPETLRSRGNIRRSDGRQPGWTLRTGLTRRVALAGIAILVVVALTVAALLAALQRVDDAGRDALEAERAVAAVGQLERFAVETQTSTRGFAVTGDNAFLANTEAARTTGRDLYERLLQATDGHDEQALVQELGVRLAALAQAYDEFVKLTRTDRAAALAQIARSRGNGPPVRAVIDSSGRLTDALVRRAHGSDEDHEQAILAAVVVGLVGSLLTAVLVALGTIQLRRRVAEPLADVATVAGRVAAGDRAARATTGGRDEIGRLQQSFNDMVDVLEEREASLQTARDDAEHGLAINQAMLETSPDGLALIDERSNFLFANAAMEQYVSEMLGEPAGVGTTLPSSREISQAIEPLTEDPAGYRAAFDRALAQPDRVHRDRYYLPRIDRTFLRIIAPVWDGGGDRVGSLVLTRDVSAELSAERQAAITRQVIDASPDGIMLLGTDGQAMLVSRRMDELMTEIMASPVEMLSFTEQPGWAERIAARMVEPQRFLQELAELRDDPLSHPAVEFTVRDSQRTYMRIVRPIERGDGTPIGTLRLLRDVTAERSAQRAKDDLMAAVSHELRTPLASILGFAELLETRELDGPVQRRYAATIHQEARRLTALVDDLIDLRLVEQGRLALSPEPVDVAGLLREQAEGFARRAERHEITVDAPAEPVMAEVDRLRLGQVLANLMSNAIKYSPDGGPVRASAERYNDHVRLAVSDRGLGIPAAQQARLFERFFRADRPAIRHIGGSGIGLALTLQLVHALGGEIGFESAEGQGSTFWVDLPLSGPAAPEA